jgi:hypothetical protein
MPLILEFEFENGDKEIERIPAEIWRYNDKTISKVFVFDRIIKKIVLDPYIELFDTDLGNNVMFAPPVFEKVELIKEAKPAPNLMQLKKESDSKKVKNQKICSGSAEVS